MEGLVVGCFGVFIALFFLVYIDFVRNVLKNNFIEHDVKTITAGDYSVEYDISADVWSTFINSTNYDKTSGITKVA